MSVYTFDKHILSGTLHGLRYERANPTENYVEIPPALLITDKDGAVWSLGHEYVIYNGVYEWSVIRNDVDIDETASKIVYDKGVVTIYGNRGRRRWTGRSFI